MDTQQALDLLNKGVQANKHMRQKLKTWQDVYYGMSLHISGAAPKYIDPRTQREIVPVNYYGEEYQYLFDNFLFSRHPREGEELRSLRYSQYRPFTKAAFGQVLEIVSGALFQDSNYVIEIADTQDRDYIWENRFSGYDLIGYYSSVGIKNISEDPNGVFLRIPSEPYYMQSNNRVDVDVWFVHTKDMVWFSPDDLIFKKDGYAYWVDTKTIYRFRHDEQTSQYIMDKEDEDGYYAHMFGKLPITVAGGEWNTHGYFESYFDKAKACADEFISTYSAAQMADKEASHPFIVAMQEDCPSCDGVGKVSDTCGTCNAEDIINCTSCDDYGAVVRQCPKCGGSGSQSRNPGQWMLIPYEQTKDGKPIQFISPDTSINKLHRETVKDLSETLFKSLHLRRTDKAESGEAKAIDQQWLYQFLSKMSNHIFDKIINDTIGDIISYRNLSNDGGVSRPAQTPFTIIKPTQFQIKTSADLLEDFEAGKNAGLPVTVRKKMITSYVDKEYNGDEVVKKTMQVINRLDTLSVYSSDELLSLRAANAITDEDLYFHRLLPQWLDELIEDRTEEWFVDAPIKTIKEAIEGFNRDENGIEV